MTGPEVLAQIAAQCDVAAQDRSLSIHDRIDLLLRADSYRDEAVCLRPSAKFKPVVDAVLNELDLSKAGYDAAGVWHEPKEEHIV